LRLLAAALVVLAAACGGGDDERPLTVFAAASLTDIFEELDPVARFNFAGSDELATQLREGADADVYAAASPRYPEELVEEGLVDEPRIFATNRLVLVVPRENPAGIRSVRELSADGVRLVVGAQGVPIGDYTRTVLESMGAADVLANVVSQEEDVKGVVGKVALGEADAGFVYATDAAVAADDVTVVELPVGSQPPIEYQIAVVSSSENTEGAQAFIDLVLSDEGREQLEAAGFVAP